LCYFEIYVVYMALKGQNLVLRLNKQKAPESFDFKFIFKRPRSEFYYVAFTQVALTLLGRPKGLAYKTTNLTHFFSALNRALQTSAYSESQLFSVCCSCGKKNPEEKLPGVRFQLSRPQPDKSCFTTTITSNLDKCTRTYSQWIFALRMRQHCNWHFP
jgi:hypothetical protein